MNEENISYGNKLRKIRHSLGVGQVEMANRLGIKQSYYSNMESDKKNISSNVINKLFAKLSVSPAWFFNNEGDIFSTSKSPSHITDENISIRNNNHTENSHQISPIDINEFAMNIDRDLLERGKGITKGRDFKTDYEYNIITSHIDFTNKILKYNNLNQTNDTIFDLQGLFAYIDSVLSHYSMLNKTMDIYEKFYNKNADLSEVVAVYKKGAQIEKGLFDILSPYLDILNEIFEKIKSFNEQHDRILCIDDIDYDLLLSEMSKKEDKEKNIP